MGYRIYAARSAKGWSQRELAERVGTSQQQIARWESGTSDIKASTAMALADALGVSLQWLLGMDDEVKRVPDSLSSDERGLIIRYRNMSEDGRKAMLDVSEGLLRSFPARRIGQDAAYSSSEGVA